LFLAFSISSLRLLYQLLSSSITFFCVFVSRVDMEYSYPFIFLSLYHSIPLIQSLKYSKLMSLAFKALSNICFCFFSLPKTVVWLPFPFPYFLPLNFYLSNIYKPVMVVYICNPNYLEDRGRRIPSLSQPRQS
jgi:hypothetical protein